MRIIIQDSYEQMSLWAASYVLQRIQHAEKSSGVGDIKVHNGKQNLHQRKTVRQRQFVLGLPTGSTPIGMYESLIKFYKEGLVSFSKVITFNMDEYVGLPHKNPQSYHYFMWDKFFSHVDVRKENINIPDGMADDLEAECQQYEQKMQEVGGVDLFVGGIGSDGHIAFNEPGSSLASRCRVKTIAKETRLANARFFDNNPQQVPQKAITVGVATIMDAREVMLLVSGQSKSVAVQHIVQQGLNHLWTASCLQLHPRAIIVCDTEAASQLSSSLIEYFKDIEAENLDYRRNLPELHSHD